MLLRLCNTDGVALGQFKLPLNFYMLPGTKFFAKLSPKESGAIVNKIKTILSWGFSGAEFVL